MKIGLKARFSDFYEIAKLKPDFVEFHFSDLDPDFNFNPKMIEKKVGTIDIFPTILDILKMKIPENIDSVSLLPLIKNEGKYNREYVLSELEVDKYESIYEIIINQKAI